MTTIKPSSRAAVSTGCGIASKPGGQLGRTAVSTGCGGKSSGGGWKPKAGGKATGKAASGKSSGLSARTKGQLDKAKGTKGRTAVSTGCGASSPSKPSKPATPAKPARTGC